MMMHSKKHMITVFFLTKKILFEASQARFLFGYVMIPRSYVAANLSKLFFTDGDLQRVNTSFWGSNHKILKKLMTNMLFFRLFSSVDVFRLYSSI